MALGRNQGAEFFTMFTDQAKNLVSGAEILTAIMDATPEERIALRDQLHEVEHSGDEITHGVTKLTNQTFITPFDREDLGEIASNLDDCLDLMDEAGDLIVLYGLHDIPETVMARLKDQVAVLSECARLTADAMPSLKAPDSLRDYWIEINRQENEGDTAYRLTLTTLFDSGIDPVTIIKLKDVIEALERCADAFESLANTVETIAVKES